MSRHTGWLPFLGHQQRLFDFEAQGSRFLIGASLGGWGSAKSTSIGRKLVKFVSLTPWRPAYGSTHPITVVTAPTARILRASTLRAIKRQVPPGLVIRERGTPHNDWLWVNGHTTLFWSVEAELEGLDVCGIVADEISHPAYHTHDRWMNYVARVRDPLSPKLMVLVAGLPEMGWVRDHFEIPAGSPRHESEITTLSGMLDNTYLPPETVEKYRQNCPAGQEQYFLRGQWRMPEFAVYEKFDTRTHVIDSPARLGTLTHAAFDFGDRAHILVGQMHGDALVVVDEIHTEGLDSPGQCARLKARGLEKGYGFGKGSRIAVDPTAKSEQLKPIRDAFPGATVSPTQRGDPYWEVEDGIRCVQRAIMDSTGRVRVKFHRGLVGNRYGIINATQTYRRNERTMHPIKDNTNDHALDTLRYLVCELLPEDRPGWRAIRK